LKYTYGQMEQSVDTPREEEKHEDLKINVTRRQKAKSVTKP